MLTTMIESFYSFKKLPFAKALAVSEVFSTDASRELHSRLDYMKDRRGILVVTGLSGVGKTLQLRTFTDSLSVACYLPIYLPLSTVTVSEFYRQINASLGGEPRFRKIDVFASLQQQIKHLVSHEKKIPIIILDEAHRLCRDVLLELQVIDIHIAANRQQPRRPKARCLPPSPAQKHDSRFNIDLQENH